MDFENRQALLTGGTGALGSMVALDLARSGARVTVTYTSGIEWRKLQDRAGADRDRLLGVSVDLTRAADVTAVVNEMRQRAGRIDFLVAVAGGFAAGKSWETDDAAWDRMLNINLRTLINVVRPVAPIMIAQRFGCIISVSSGAILGGTGAGIAAYAVSKTAVRQLTEILAEELKPFGIRCHSILPGTMDTEANRRAMPGADRSAWVKPDRVAQIMHELLKSPETADRSVAVPVLE